MAIGNGTSSTNQCVSDGRLKARSLGRVATAQKFSYLSYVHDPDGIIAAIDDKVTPARSAIYGYDAMGRMNMMVAQGASTPASYTAIQGTNRIDGITEATGKCSIS